MFETIGTDITFRSQNHPTENTSLKVRRLWARQCFQNIPQFRG